MFTANTITNLRKIVYAEYSNRAISGPDQEFFYVVSADMAKDGTANTAVVVYKVRPKEISFTYSLVNLFSIDTTDYETVSNILKKTVLDYNAKLLVYDANGIGAAIRDWINKRSVGPDGMTLEGLGIINPPTNSEKDLIKYNDQRTICYEIKATGEKADQIHKVFFSRISNGTVRFLIKTSEAANRFVQLKGFKKMSNAARERRMRPYMFMDRMEVELKNLEIVDTSDNINKSMKIRRRDPKIQKDFFSAAEYGVYATNLHIELEYYGRRNRLAGSAADFVLID